MIFRKVIIDEEEMAKEISKLTGINLNIWIGKN
jgi:hypothetical protein